jgi:hypothetical protein
MTGRLPLALSSVHVAVGWLSIIFLPLLFAWSWLTKRHALSALILLTAAGLIGNAFIIGTLSEVHDRYNDLACAAGLRHCVDRLACQPKEYSACRLVH